MEKRMDGCIVILGDSPRVIAGFESFFDKLWEGEAGSWEVRRWAETHQQWHSLVMIIMCDTPKNILYMTGELIAIGFS